MTILFRNCLVCLLWAALSAPALVAAQDDAPGDQDDLLQLQEQIRSELDDPELAADIAKPDEAISTSARERQQILSRTELALARHLEALERAARPKERREAIRQNLLDALERIERNGPVDIETLEGFLRATLDRTRSVEAARTLFQLATAQVDEARAALEEALQQRRQLIDALKKAQQKGDGVDRRLRDMELADARVRELRVTLEAAMADRDAVEGILRLEEQLAELAGQLGKRAVATSLIDESAQKRVLGELDSAEAEARQEIAENVERMRNQQLLVVNARQGQAGSEPTPEGRSVAAMLEAEVNLVDLKIRQLRARLLGFAAMRELWDLRLKLQEQRSQAVYRDAMQSIRESQSLAGTLREIAGNERRNLDQELAGLDAELADWSPAYGNRRAVADRRDTLRRMRNLYDGFFTTADELDAYFDIASLHVEYLISGRTMIDSVAEVTSTVSDWFWGFWTYELFTVEETIEVDGRTITGSLGITVSKVVSSLLMVTLGVWLTIVLGRLVRRLMLTRGGSETTANLSYRLFNIVLVFVLFVAALNTVNIPFTTFSFLGGALAIGVGFGAQNLLNNFISGLILLMERPIEIGHVIEVDGIRGRVREIGARFSQIRRFDGVDMLVPNSLLLEQKVTNLTLEDQNIRLQIRVGVAYGSSTRDAGQCILASANEHGLVLKNPPPYVIFEEFGDSALVFSLYFWVTLESSTSSLVIASDVRHMIDRQLRDAGITIAFPQRDVHLDVKGPVDVRLDSGPGTTTSEKG